MHRRKWTQQKIIRRIQQWHQDGVPIGKMYRKDRAMTTAAWSVFGSWRTALQEAGLESERQTWTRGRVLSRLRQCHRDRQRVDTKLYAAAVRYFGSMREARAAAGLPAPRQRAPNHNWSRDEVVAEIRRRHESGGNLSLNATHQEHPALYAAAKHWFSSWSEARAAAGYPPRTVRSYPADEVLQRIRQRHAAGLPMSGIRDVDPILERSAKHAYGGWWAAVRAAGLEHLAPRRWSKRAVVRAIHQRQERGLLLSETWKQDKGLFRAAVRYFGNWTNALEAADIEPRFREAWSKERVIERLQVCARRNRGRNLRQVDPNLAAAATRLFGSFSAALEAAGVDPPARRWTDARVVAAIQDRYVTGKPLHIEGLGDIRLANAAKRRFGSWKAAVEAAGLTGKIIIKKPLRRWTREDVLAEIRAWHASGRRLPELGKANQSLYCAAKTHFGSWGAAMTAAGFSATRRSWSKQAVIDEIHKRVRRGESLSSGHPVNRNLAAVAYRYFGSWRKAVQAAGVTHYQGDRRGA